MQVMGIPESRIYVQTRQESFCTYVMNQPREIWRHQAVLFEYEKEVLKGRVLHTNTRTTPVVARVESEEGWQVPLSGLQPEEKDETFLRMIREVFANRPVSAVYLVGDGFEEKWYEKSLQILCSGRRVFAGNNLYAKGACYRAADAVKKQEPEKYLFLGEDKISYNVGLRTNGVGKNNTYALVNAGESWYEAKAVCEALLCEEPVVEFVLQPMQGDAVLKVNLPLEGLPKRPNKATRLLISVAFLSVDRLRVEVKDLGFGELFPSTDLCWTEDVDLGQPYEV